MKLLAIDDHQDNLIALQAVLKDALPECQVFTAPDGPRGLQMARAEDPDVILLDIVMPDMDGFEVCRRLKADAVLRPIPVVFLTALRTDKASRIRALEIGAEAFLAKPFDEQELLAQIRAMAKVKLANRFQRMEKEELAALLAERNRELEWELAERRKAEAGLRASEERFRMLADGAPEAIFIQAKGAFTYVNAAALRLFGAKSGPELTGQPVASFFDANCREALHQQLRPTAHGAANIEWEEEVCLRLAGTDRELYISAVDFGREGLDAVLVFAKEVTERRRAEQALRTSQAELNRAQAVAHVGSWHLDVQSGELRWSDETYRIFELPLGNRITQESFLEFVHPDDRPRLSQDHRSFQSGVAYEFRVNVNGKVKWLREAAEVAADAKSSRPTVLGTVHDITERKLMEEELRASERRFQAVFQSSPNSVLLTRPDTAKIMEVNDAFTEFTGYSREEAVGRTTLELGLWANPEMRDPLMRQVVQTGIVRAQEMRIRRKDGGIRIALLSMAIFSVHSEEWLVASLVDITERRVAEDRLRDAEARHRAIVETEPECIKIVDAQGRLLHMNPAGLAMIEADSLEQVQGKEVIEMVHPEHREAFAALHRQVIAGGTGDLQFEMIGLRGAPRWMETHAAPLAQGGDVVLLAVTRDVTRRKQAEEALARNQAELQAIYDSAPVLMCVLDDELRILYANTSFEEFAGLAPRAGVGKRVGTVLGCPAAAGLPEDGGFGAQCAACSIKTALEETWKTGQSCHNLEFHGWLARGGQDRETTLLVSTARIETAGTKRVMLCLIDITARKRVETSLRFTQFAMEHMADAALWISRDGRFDYVNAAATRLLGYSREEFGGLRIWNVVSELQGEEWPRHWQELERAGAMHFESLYLTKPGLMVPVEVLANHMALDGQEYDCAFVRDITERKRAEDVMNFLARASVGGPEESFFPGLARYLVRSLGVDYVCIDSLEEDGLSVRTVAAWGRGQLAPSGIHTLKETARIEVLGKEVCCVPEDAARRFPTDPVLQELDAQSYLGVTLWGHTGEPIGLIAAISHRPLRNRAAAEATLLTVALRASAEMERLMAAEALRENEEQLRSLINAMPDFVCFKDGAGRWLLANESGLATFNLNGKAYQGKTDLELAQYDHSFRAVFEGCLASDERTWQAGKLTRSEETVPRPDGSSPIFDVAKVPLFTSSGERRALVVLGRDVTERKRLEASLKQKLVALTQPLDRPEGLTFEDLFELAAIQRLQDDFAAATGVASIITRPDGTPITQPSRFCRLCSDIIRCTETGRRNCYHSDALLGRHHPEGPIVQPCLSGGLWDAGASITVGNRHIANWLIGQVRDATQTEDQMRAYARTIGADEEAVVQAFLEVPSMERERFDQVARALFTLASQLSSQAYQNVQQARFITARQEAEATLRQTEERFRRAVESSPFPVLLHAEDGTVLHASKSWYDISGYSTEELPTMEAWTERAYPTRKDAIRAAIGELYSLTGPKHEGDFQVVTKSGTHRIWEFSSAPLGTGPDGRRQVISMAVDVTDRRRSEDELAQTRALLQAAMDHSPVGIALAQAPSGQLTYVNRAGMEIPDRTEAELLQGVDLQRIVSAWDVRQLDGSPMTTEELPLTRALLQGETTSGEMIIRRPSGEDRYVLVSAAPVRNRDQEIVQGIVVFLDLTERRRLEQERLAMASRLRNTQKLESIGTLAAGVAHEINNPLNGVMNYTQLLLDESEPGTRAANYLGEVMHETQRIATIVKNLLQFSRQERQYRSLADPATLVQDTLDLVKAVMRNDQIILQVSVPRSLPGIRCHNQQIQQVIMNLLTNARDALNERYTGYHDNKIILVSGQAMTIEGAEWVRLTVADHGAGIPEAVRERVFDPFFTTKGRDRGTGLGLSISLGMVQEHGGRLWFETQPGEGTQFHLDLPVPTNVAN